jgi:predicted metal-dependent hydrolase
MSDDPNIAQTGPTVRVIRSDNRRKTVAARLVDGGAVLEILAPSRLPEAELAPIIEKLRERVMRQAERPARERDQDLSQRAAELNRQYFDGKLKWNEIRYVTNQNFRYGSCTPMKGTIRISHRLLTMPTWVRDYVLIHEMAHLREPNHGPGFWKLVNQYPLAERARGYLMAMGLENEADEPNQSDVL